MPTPHTDLALWADPVSLPEDADLVSPTAAVINAGPAAVLNRHAFLAETVAPGLSWLEGGATTHQEKRAVVRVR